MEQIWVKKLPKSIVPREKMTTFREKIDKLLIVNGKNLKTIEEIEDFAEIGSKTLRKAYTENREPTPRTLGKLFTKFEIDGEAWWKGKVEFLQKNHTRVSESPLRMEAVPKELEEVRVPLVHDRAYAGYLRGYADPEYMESLPTTTVNRDMVRGGKYVAFTIKGDSMDNGTSRAILDKDVVLGKELAQHHWKNKIHLNSYPFIIVHKTEGIICKDITAHDVENGIITVHSRNPIYDDFELNLSDIVQMFFVVQLVERKLKL